MTDRQTDRPPRYSVGNNRPHLYEGLRSAAMRPNNTWCSQLESSLGYSLKSRLNLISEIGKLAFVIAWIGLLFAGTQRTHQAYNR